MDPYSCNLTCMTFLFISRNYHDLNCYLFSVVLKMSAENLACCLKCQMTFKTHEELFVHSCAQIKIEKPEPEDDNPIEKYTKLLNTLDQQDFKYDLDHQDFSESDSDYSPKKKSKKEKKFGKTKVAKKKEIVKQNVRKIEEDNQKVEGKELCVMYLGIGM